MSFRQNEERMTRNLLKIKPLRFLVALSGSVEMTLPIKIRVELFIR